ncbi:MAG: hypothetical protein DCE90_01750 [Pseudanabaena sp.]|nr:MAG: hypothetical protein DCE90_01750 [Pseudanabaena sp.]
MDSTLLNQVRHLCRDRASYEHLKAILVQQERVHRLSWEERYEQIIATQTSDQQSSNIFGNILVREKALAQLADAIQRSPSLDLVLQVAVQVAQKLLQVDRVAIFRCDAEGRGEFTTDAIAAGLTSLADMPERQLSLSRHMVESTQAESSVQIIDSIRSSSLSSHIVTLLEQIGISSYAANKIYAGQGVWGTLVAFHSSVSYFWTESDRTSLSLVATQISVAIALANLRQQTQELSSDLQTLQVELNQLQQTVTELAKNQSLQSKIPVSTISEIFPEIETEVVSTYVEEAPVNLISGSLEAEEVQVVKEEELAIVEVVNNDLEEEPNQSFPAVIELPPSGFVETNIDSIDVPISNAEVQTPEYLAPLIISPDKESEVHLEEELANYESEPTSEHLDSSLDALNVDGDLFAQSPIELSANSLSLDDLQSLAVEPEILTLNHLEIKEETLAAYEPQPLEISAEVPVSQELSEEPSELEIEASSPSDASEIKNEENFDLESEVPEVIVSELNKELHETTQVIAETEPKDNAAQSPTLPITLTEARYEPATTDNSESLAEVVPLAENLATDPNQTEPIEIETKEPSEFQKIAEQIIQNSDIGTNTVEASTDEDGEEEPEPTIELQFIETIVAIAENREQGVKVLLNVIDSFLEEAPRLVQTIDKALAVNDHARLLQALNSLRANSDYVGALTLSYQCRQLESAVRANYVVLIYASLSQVAIEAQRATDALRLERSRYAAAIN